MKPHGNFLLLIDQESLPFYEITMPMIFPIHPALLHQSPSIRREVREALMRFQFPPDQLKRAEDILVRQIRISRLQTRSIPGTHFKNEIDVEQHFDWQRFYWSKGRGRTDQSLKRAHLIATCFRVWVLAFGEVPKTNNRGYARTPFMQFVHQLLRREGIGKLESHMESFRSYRKKAQHAIQGGEKFPLSPSG